MRKLISATISFIFIATSVVSQNTEETTIGSVYPNLENQIKITPNNSKLVCDTVISFSTPEDWPSGLAWDGNFLWASGYNKPFIFKMDVLGNVLDSIPSPTLNSAHGGGLEFDGTYLWVVVEEDGILYKVDTNTGSVLQQIILPTSGSFGSNNLGIAFDGQYLWNTHSNDNFLYKIDPSNGQVLASIPTLYSMIAIEWINGKLYGVNSFFNPTPYLYEIDTLTGQLVDSVDWCLNLTSDLTWDGNSLWAMTTIGFLRIHKMGSSLPISIVENSSEFIENSVLLYPNPTQDIVLVETKNIIDVSLTNIRGKDIPIILNGNKIDLSKLLHGVYFLSIINDNGLVVKKVIKQ
jgi:outer membrane protein assembly factor BamB